MSRHAFCENNAYFLGMKTFDCMYEERLMSLIRNCGASYVELISHFKLYGRQDL